MIKFLFVNFIGDLIVFLYFLYEFLYIIVFWFGYGIECVWSYRFKGLLCNLNLWGELLIG